MSKRTNELGTNVEPWSRHDIPEGAILVKTYGEFQRFIARWTVGEMRGNLIVIGAAGIGKTETALQEVANAVGKAHLYIKGDASKFGVYSQLFHHIDQPVILDDLDSLLRDSGVTGLLKMLLETKGEKIIQRNVAQLLKETEEGGTGLPAEFVTKSRTLILVNELKQVSKNFQAALDRATMLWFAPDCREVAKYVAGWFNLREHRDVYEYVTARLGFAIAPSCRLYYKAQDWKESGFDWRSMVDRQLQPSDQRVATYKRVQADPTLKNEKQRAAEFVKLTGMHPTAYYATRKACSTVDGTRSARSLAISAGMRRKHAERKAGGK